MSTLNQAHRLLQIKSPLGDNALLLTGFSGREEMSRLFHFELELLSNTKGIPPTALVGKKVTFTVEQSLGGAPIRRHFHGLVNRFSAGMWDKTDKVQHYHAEVVPWLWLLTRTSNCRIFQHMTVPEIILDVFKKRGFSGAEFVDDSGLDKGQHPKWDYCVQYRETDFNFVSRLMEQEGIFYYFKFEFHEETQTGKHVLHLCNKTAYMQATPNTLDYHTSTGATRHHDGISSWVHQFEFRPGQWSQTDYDFRRPRLSLMENEKIATQYDQEGTYEIYDYPAEYDMDEKGKLNKKLTRVRQEEEETPQDVVHGSANIAGINPGAVFKVGKHPNQEEEEGKSYVVTAVHHVAHEPSGYGTGEHHGQKTYTNSFACIPSDRTFRPARMTPKPVVQGTQTAIVVGPKGSEIYTDPDGYGRVKVQFHWDRLGKHDENSSLWIRVAQNWAGKRWGAFFLPRIGQEVIVAFLEGDPDQPIIVGSVYNGDQMHPYLGKGLDPKHPHDPNLSGFKTNSTKGGKGYNELRFNDTAGKEQVFIHAQKDLDTRVRNDHRERVCGNQHLIVGGEKDGKKWGDLTEKIYKDKHLDVQGNTQEHYEKDLTVLVGHGEQGGGGNLDLQVEKDRTTLIEGNDHLAIQKDCAIGVGGGMSLTVDGDLHEKVGGKQCTEALQEIHIKSGMKLIIEAGMQLSLKGPGGFIDIGMAGVTIQGTMVKINSGGKAGDGSGAKPKAPKKAKKAAPNKPAKADQSKSGMKSAYD